MSSEICRVTPEGNFSPSSIERAKEVLDCCQPYLASKRDKGAAPFIVGISEITNEGQDSYNLQIIIEQPKVAYLFRKDLFRGLKKDLPGHGFNTGKTEMIDLMQRNHQRGTIAMEHYRGTFMMGQYQTVTVDTIESRLLPPLRSVLLYFSPRNWR